MDGFLTPAGCGEAEYVVKRSRFIGRVWPAETEEEARARLDEIRAAHWDAAHNVYAWILREGNAIRYSDDGEPQGTAGLPALEVFRREGIQNVLCVITRYFGGVLLGAPGLTRAYAHTAKLALDAAGIARWRLWARLQAVCPYALFETVRRELLAQGAALEHADYAAEITLTAGVAADQRDALRHRITEVTAGAVNFVEIENGMGYTIS
jgi:uncharacterized YigZ family protein